MNDLQGHMRYRNDRVGVVFLELSSSLDYFLNHPSNTPAVFISQCS